MTVRWYVLRSKPNKENFLGELVQAHHVEIYYPAIRAKAVNPHTRKIKPYFPEYLFVHVDLDKVSTSFWLWLPGSRGLVSIEGTPAVVPDELIAAIRQDVNAINDKSRERSAGLKSREPNTLPTGPFFEYDAIFNECVTGNDRVRVLLNHLRDRRLSIISPAV